MKFEKIANIKSGNLLNRLKESNDGNTYIIYDQLMFKEDSGEYINNDLKHKKITVDKNNTITEVRENDIILNLMSGDCVVSIRRKGKIVLPYNYAIIDPLNDIDKGYLAFWFQYSKECKKQMSKYFQGSTLVKKITLSKLKKFNITIPDIQDQKIISNIYHKKIRLNRLRSKKEILENEIMINILK